MLHSPSGQSKPVFMLVVHYLVHIRAITMIYIRIANSMSETSDGVVNSNRRLSVATVTSQEEAFTTGAQSASPQLSSRAECPGAEANKRHSSRLAAGVCELRRAANSTRNINPPQSAG